MRIMDRSASSEPLLSVENLTVRFGAQHGVLRPRTTWTTAVSDVSFMIHAGETLGLVGESGCGKTTAARAVLRLIQTPFARMSGSVRFNGKDVFKLKRRALRHVRRDMQIIFQDPLGSLNPRLRIGQILSEPIRVHGLARGAALKKRVTYLLERCGLWADAAKRFPHEFSGGQRQRIVIARALAVHPKLIICDEPTSALDVSIQAQILNLLDDLQEDFGLSYLFISHDMAVVDHFCDRIAVMKDGAIVEHGPREQIISEPQHPYTQQLLAAVPQPMATLG